MFYGHRLMVDLSSSKRFVSIRIRLTVHFCVHIFIMVVIFLRKALAQPFTRLFQSKKKGFVPGLSFTMTQLRGGIPQSCFFFLSFTMPLFQGRAILPTKMVIFQVVPSFPKEKCDKIKFSISLLKKGWSFFFSSTDAEESCALFQAKP